MELRPLGFGEIFDRSITLYIRNFVPFAAIVAVMVVPYAVMQYFVDLSQQPQIDYLLRVLRHPEAAKSVHPPSAFDSPAAIVVIIVAVVFLYGIWPFALNAVAVGVARLYRDKPVEFGPCYRAVLARWPQVLGVLVLEFLVLIGWYVAFLIATFAGIFLAAMLSAVNVPMAVFAGVLAGIVMLAFFLLLAPLVCVLAFAMYAAVIEQRGVIEAIGISFSRVFNRGEFWRATLFAVSAGAILLGASMVIGVVALVAMVFHATVVQVLLESLARAAVTPFSVVLMAVYYFDVRIRREGFDLEAGLERLAADTVAVA